MEEFVTLEGCDLILAMFAKDMRDGKIKTAEDENMVKTGCQLVAAAALLNNAKMNRRNIEIAERQLELAEANDKRAARQLELFEESVAFSRAHAAVVEKVDAEVEVVKSQRWAEESSCEALIVAAKIGRSQLLSLCSALGELTQSSDIEAIRVLEAAILNAGGTLE